MVDHEVEDKIATAAEEHPEFKGQAAPRHAVRGHLRLRPGGPAWRLLTDLGFTYPAAVPRSDEEFGGSISVERPT